MSSIKNKLTNLTEVPLGMDQIDNITRDATANKGEKTKSNSLKQFFRTAKSSMTKPKSSDVVADRVCESDIKNVHSLQLRVGSFQKNHGEEKETNSKASSSAEVLKLEPIESRLKLEIANCWNKAFKKSSKKSLTNKNRQFDEKITPSQPSQDDSGEFENNHSTNL